MTIYRVEAPDGQILRVEGPENAPQDQIVNFAIAQYLGSKQETTEAPAPVAPKRAEDVGFLEGAGAALQRGLSSFGDIGAGLGLAAESTLGTEEATRRKMQEIRAEQMKPQATPGTKWEDIKRIYAEKGLGAALSEAPKYATEQILQSAPQMAAPLAAGAAATPFLTPVGGAVVGMGTYALQQFGNFLVRQAVEKDDPKELEVTKAALTAAGTAPIGYFADRFTFGLGSAGKQAGKEIVEELAARSATGAITNGLGKIGKGVAAGVIAEAPTEVLEQAAERYQAGLSLTGKDAAREYEEAFFGAAAAGGGIKGVSTAVGLMRGPQAPQEIQPVEEPAISPEATIAEPAPGKTEAQQEGEALAGMLQEREIQQGIYEPEAQPEVVPPVPPVAQPEVTVPPIQEPQEAPTIETPVAQPMAEAPVVEPPAVEPTPAADPVQAEATQTNWPSDIPTSLFRGYGREERGAAYGSTVAPIAGRAKYFAFDQDTASEFGPNIETAESPISNPYVIRDGDQWRKLTKEAGWPNANPSMLPAEKVEQLTEKLQNLLKKRGHDGMIVYWDNQSQYDIGPNGENYKTLNNVFGVPQAVVFEGAKTPEIKPAKPLPADLHPIEARDIPGQQEAYQEASRKAEEAGIDTVIQNGRINPELTTVDWNEVSKYNNLGGLLNHIAPHVPVDYAEIIKKILPSVKNIPLNVVNRVGGAPRALGAYKPAIVKATGDVVRHSVELSTANNGNDISTIVHEALHGATVSNYYRGKKGNETYAQAAKDLDSLTRKLFALVNEGKANLPFMQDYKRANLARELISWGQTDRQVQAELKKIVMPNKKTAWSEFVTTMRKLLGLPANQTTALEHLLDISERLTSQQDVLRGAPRGPVQEEVDVLAKEARTPEFRKWFGDSKIVDANGNPLVVYHGTKRDFTEFKPAYDDGLIFFTTNPEFASKWPVGSGGLRQAPEGTEQEYRRIRQLESDLYSQYMRPSDEYDFNTSEGRTAYDKDRNNLKDAIKKATGYSSGIEFEQKAGIRVIPAYLSIKNPFDPRVDYKKIEEFLTKQGKQDVVNAGYHKSGNWLVYENKDVINELKRLGYDGIYIAEDLGGPHETIAAFRPNQAKSVFNERPTEEEDILAKETPEQVQSRHRTIENELIKSANNSIPELDEMGRKERLVDSIVYNLGDKFKDLKDIQDSLKADIKEKLAKFNAHMREALYHGRIAKQTADFEKDELLPLAQQMYARGVSKEELNNHLLARRAEEYNDKIDARIDQESGQFSHLQGRGSGVATQIADAYLRGANKNEVAQLRRLFTDNEGKSTLTSNETKLLDQLEKMTPQKRKSLEELSQRVYKMVEKTQQLAIDNGLETKETVDYWRDTSPNYVPLKRSEEELDFAMAHSGSGRGFSVKAGISKAATGSLKTVDDILDNIILQRDMAIVKGEKARIARAFFGITLAAPNPKLYMAVDPETSVIGQANKVLARLQYLRAKLADLNAKIQIDMDQEGSAVATDLARADEMNQQIQKLDAQYTDLAKKAEAVKQKIEQELEANGYDPKDIKNLFLEPQGVWYNPKTKKIEYRTNSFLRSSENVIAVPINGSTKYIFMNTGSERAMRLAKSFKNADVEQLGMATALVARFTRYISAINTQWNPVFGIINVMRDIQGAQLNLSTTALKGKQLAVDKNIIPAVTSIWQSLRSGKPSGKFGQEWLEFQKLGGQTGIKDMLVNIRKNESILDKELAKLQESGVQKIARSSVRAIFGIISDFNDTMENAVRLAAFIEAKKVFGEKYSPDLAADKAADLAKNLTVNFNRKGAKTNILNSWVGFFNASAQGTARLIETLKGPSGKKIMSSLVLLGAIQQMMIAAAGFRDDDPPEFVRERNLIIPTGDGKYKTWPMPLGFNLFVNFGRLLTSTVESGGKNAAKNIASLMNVTLQTFNPLGGETVAQAITPTVGEIPLALATNVDAFGRPIYREDRPGRPMPGYLRSTEGATEISKGLAEIMNKMTGGTDYQKGWASPTADQIDYIAGQLGGGVFREARKTYEYGKAKAAGEEVAPYRVPLAGRFMGDTGSEANVRNRFYESMNKMASYEAEIKGRLTHGQPIQDFLKETPEARMYQTANTFENEINKINKMRKQLIERGASKEELKRLNERKIQIMRQFNAMYDKATESEYPSQ